MHTGKGVICRVPGNNTRKAEHSASVPLLLRRPLTIGLEDAMEL